MFEVYDLRVNIKEYLHGNKIIILGVVIVYLILFQCLALPILGRSLFYDCTLTVMEGINYDSCFPYNKTI